MSGADDEDALLLPDEAAKYLRLTKKTLENYRLEEMGPAYVKLGPGKKARVAYLKKDLVAWVLRFRQGGRDGERG